MSSNRSKLENIPVNIITGFLGVGKTTAIQHLLSTKPDGERWAVLVNEFGEVGIDGSLFQGQNSEGQGVFIKEVPGGCMCCTAGLPMQIALNQLLQRAKPDRLLIEPTGLGHPLEVLSTLQDQHYKDVLDIQKIVTLVDARVLQDQRYATHDSFKQQVAIADVVVGNKSESYSELDKETLERYAAEHARASVSVYYTEQGQLDSEWLKGGRDNSVKACDHKHDHDHDHDHDHHHGEPETYEVDLGNGMSEAKNNGEGFLSIGWRISPKHTFDRDRLFSFLSGVKAERLKAVCITEDGIFGYNMSAGALSEFELDDCIESRIEAISLELDDTWREALLACLV